MLHAALLPLKEKVRGYYSRWLSRRVPARKKQQLCQRNIFIFPSIAGLVFLCLVLLLWLLGTNYQNNLILALSFLLLSMMIVSILHTYANLSGLKLQVVNTKPGFVGGDAEIVLRLSSANRRSYQSIRLSWPDNQARVIDIVEGASQDITLPVTVAHRGWFEPGRLRVETVFPLGIICAWAKLDFATPLLGYPEPIESEVTPQQQALNSTDELGTVNKQAHHGDEFAGIREYQLGDSPRQINWRSLARGQGLATKMFEQQLKQQLWLDWEQFGGLTREARLSRLCFCALRLGDEPVIYGLKLPGVEIVPDQGASHRQAILTALATFESKPPEAAGV